MKVEIVQNSKVLRVHRHEDEVFVEAPPSGDYSVRLVNDTHKRVLAVLAVDGINAIDGTDAGFSGPGYVLESYQTMEIPGWSRGKDKVAAFSFADKGESYAEKTGRGTENAGVIGVAVFEEKVEPVTIIRERHYWPWQPWTNPWPWSPLIPYRGSQTYGNTGVYCSSATNNMKSVDSGLATKGVVGTVDLGTAYGHEADFHTVNTTFERASSPSMVLSLRYATKETLKAWGVPVDAPKVPSKPKAFPKSEGCPAPVGWRG